MLNKDIHQLEKTAIKWWPIEIQELAQQISIIPKLLATHDRFISILKLSDPNEPKSIFDVIRASNFPANVFVKHLSILTDFGGELLKRLSKAQAKDIYNFNSETKGEDASIDELKNKSRERILINRNDYDKSLLLVLKTLKVLDYPLAKLCSLLPTTQWLNLDNQN